MRRVEGPGDVMGSRGGKRKPSGSGIERQEPGSSKEEGVGYRRPSQPRKRSRDAASLHFPFTVGR